MSNEIKETYSTDIKPVGKDVVYTINPPCVMPLLEMGYSPIGGLTGMSDGKDEERYREMFPQLGAGDTIK